MTTEPRALVEVEQVDRDAALALRTIVDGARSGGEQALYRCGAHDHTHEVQAFARHRLEALRTQGDGELVLVPREPTEAMVAAGEHAAWDDGNSMPAIRAIPRAYAAMLSAAPTQASSREGCHD